MEYYNTKREFKIQNSADFEKRLLSYFEFYNFKLTKESSDQFVFTKNISLLDGWKINPLNWQSKIEVNINNAKLCSVDYKAYGNGQFYSIGFVSLFEALLNNLIGYINHNKNFKEANAREIRLAKKKVIIYTAIIFGGALLGLLAGMFIFKLTEYKIFYYAGIIIGAVLARNLLNQNMVKKNTKRGLV